MPEVYALDDWKLAFEYDGDSEPSMRLGEGIRASLNWCKENQETCGKNLGIARAQMPQISRKQVPEFLEHLKDMGITYRDETVTAGSLHATQREINTAKVAKIMEGYSLSGERLLTSKDNYILDGHHRWAALLSLDPKNKMKITRVNLPIQKLLKVAREWRGSQFRDITQFKEARAARVADLFLRPTMRTAAADVTPVRQRTQFSCMATSMMMCLRAHGVECSEDEVAKVMGVKPMQGATWEDAIACAQHYGCRATLVCPSTVDQMRRWTDAGTPVIIAWNPEGRDWSHASVVFDVKEDGTVLVADPNIPDPDETVREVPKGEFYKKWSEKWPRYLVRRPAMAVTREITEDGRQIAASQSRAASVADTFLAQRRARYQHPFNPDAMLEMIEADPEIYRQWKIHRNRFRSKRDLLEALYTALVAAPGQYKEQMRYEQIVENL